MPDIFANVDTRLNNFAVGISTSPFIDASDFGTFIFFGVMSVLAVLWVYFFLPETKGRTLEEMDEIFGESGFAQADLALKQRIERDIGLTALIYGDGYDEKKYHVDQSKKQSVEGNEFVEDSKKEDGEIKEYVDEAAHPKTV